MTPDYKICNTCIMDTSASSITFNEKGICSFCTTYSSTAKKKGFEPNEHLVEAFVSKLKKNRSAHRKYDCVVGISGGVDSSYLAYLLKSTYGLNPLAVHLDNGWNSELAINNIESLLKKLDIDLYTHILDWNEFKDLQLSFLRASVPDAEIPTDHAIFASLFRVAKKFNIPYIVTGVNHQTEFTLPKEWSQGHFDWKYIKSIQQKYGKTKLKSFPKLSLFERYILFPYIYRIKSFPILSYLPYNKADAINLLASKFNWRNYKSKHGESTYTKFVQDYYLPKKFNIDKRRAHLSNLIQSKQMNRNDALDKINNPLLETHEKTELTDYVMKKLHISEDDFNAIMNCPIKKFEDFPSYQRFKGYTAVKQFYYRYLKNGR